MPQMNKGGKFIFGKSVIRADGTVRIPPQAVQEYQIAAEGRVYLFTGSRSTGGFCVTRRGLLEPSQLGRILSETPRCCTEPCRAARSSPTRAAPAAGRTVRRTGRSSCLRA